MLEQTLVGSSGLRSSRVALGTMNFGDQRKWGCTSEEALAILVRFTEAGGTTIDTAPNYADGRSEEIVGDFARSRRDELVLATKYTASSSKNPLAGGNSRRSMIQSVEASLRRLKTDRIDLLWLHFWDFTTPLDEILRAADDLVRMGKILYFGLSDTPAWVAARAVTLASERRTCPVVAIQVEYNAARRSAEADLLPMADALGLGVFCWGPLAAGALAAGDNPHRLAPQDINDTIQKVRAGLLSIAGKTGCSPRRLALRWLMDTQPSNIPILGARTSAQMGELLEDADQPLSDEVIGELTALVPRHPLFPNELIRSSYLRKFALGMPTAFAPVNRPRC